MIPDNKSSRTQSLQKTQLRKHPVYWFDDGSLILRIQDHLFKVHRMLLTRHSRYLKSLHEIQRESSRHELKNLESVLGPGPNLDYECDYIAVDPIHQSHITAEDAEALLQHIYHDVPSVPASPLSHVVRILRISGPRHLDFPNIHVHSKEIFVSMFPGGPLPFPQPQYLHEALTLANQLQIASVRKAILYTLVTKTSFEPDTGNTIASPEEAVDIVPEQPINTSEHFTSSNCGAQEPPHPLLPADLELCRRLMTRLIEHFTPILFTPAATPHMACTDVFADTWMQFVIQPALEDDGVYKPLESLERIKGIDWASQGLCPSCVIEKREEWLQEQETVWRLMDSWLGSTETDSQVW